MHTEEQPRRTSQVKGASDPRRQQFDDQSGTIKLLKGLVVVLALMVAGSLGYSFFGGSDAGPDLSLLPTVPVKRGDLTVSVTEGGALRAMVSIEIKSEVEGSHTILELVDEGTVITQKDVDDKMQLVKLDVSDLEERKGQREISYLNAQAQNTKAIEDYDIQVNQNESNIAIAELNLKFAQMELERYVGSRLAAILMSEGYGSADLGKLAEEEVTRIFSVAADEEEAIRAAAAGTPNADVGAQIVDAALAATELLQQDDEEQGVLALGGVARQTLRDHASTVLLARETLAQDENDLKWTRDLYDKEFVSRNDLREDELSVTRSRVNVATAEEELRLYRLYTLPKEVEQRHADYVETVRDLKRVEARARSELAQKEAEKKSKQASLQLEKERFEKAELMMSKATITAPVPGRVVYASTTDAWRRMRDPMQEGKNVRENESLIVIPDISTLAARVNIHETDVEKVRIGQPALISVEAMPDRPLPGKVARISPVASAAHAWLNPDIKVYDTDVTLDEVPEGLTPGMSATAEIVVADLRNVLYVPIEAVNTHRGERVCWVKKADGQPELRPVECGHFTDKFVEITKGLSEGEQVYLEPPVTLPETEADNQPRKLEIEVKPVDDQALPEVEEEEEVSDSGYVTPDGMIDWQKLMAAIQPLIDSGKWTELSAKMAEIRESLPEELRPEFDAAIKKGQEQYAAATGGG